VKTPRKIGKAMGNTTKTVLIVSAFRIALNALISDIDKVGVVWTSSVPWDEEEVDCPPYYQSHDIED